MADSPPQAEPEDIRRPARYGLILFAIYLVLYGGFVFLAVFRTSDLDEPIVADINLAIVYGLGLIVAAIILAMVYVVLCEPVKRKHSPGGDER